MARIETSPVTLLSSFQAAPSPRHARPRLAPAPGRDGIPSRAADGGPAEAAPPDWISPDGIPARPGRAIASSAGSAMLRRAISGVDGYLSSCCGVKPYSGDERCLLRYAAIPSPGAYRLSDGTAVRPGDGVIDLHLWNEHIPPVPKAGPDLAWARLLARRMDHSLALLAAAAATHPELRGAKAVRARTNFVGWGRPSESLSRLIGRFGFEDVDEGAASLPARVHDALENVLIGALTWTHNPEALRRDKLIRQRRPVWMSTDLLRRRHSGR